ncbi:MAG: HU family DNA-binding protein, partial [Prevotella sp.]|nr:HU family DNA-binding protein [Prevotella sp.]
MTKADIVNQITDETGIAKKEVSAVIEAFMEKVKGSLLENKENVYLRGFGSFIV